MSASCAGLGAGMPSCMSVSCCPLASAVAPEDDGSRASSSGCVAASMKDACGSSVAMPATAIISLWRVPADQHAISNCREAQAPSASMSPNNWQAATVHMSTFITYLGK